MISYIVRRVLYMIPMLVAITIAIFLLMYIQPGDAVDVLCGLGCPPDLREEMREQYGLDEPVYAQYANWISGVICMNGTGRCPDFGWSVNTSQPAWSALVGDNRFAYTAALLLVAMMVSWLIAIPIGIYSATRKYSLGDHVFTFLGFVGLSVPNFILGLLFIFFVVVVLQLSSVDPFFQVGGFLNADLYGEPFSAYKAVNFLWHFLPPVFIIAAANIAAITRYMRGSLLDVLGMDYVQTARAKGLSERIVVWKHAVRNAINPLITMLGFWLPYMMEGALVIAIVFNLPQMEKTFIEAIEFRDASVVMSGLFVFSVILMLGNLIADILLALSDPKIRYE